MQRKISFSEGEYYHIYNRGTDKRVVYSSHDDYMRFLALMYICNNIAPVNIREQFPKGVSFVKLKDITRDETLVDVGAYCLMPNHFHILVKEKKEEGITKFISKLATGYSMYFNSKYERTGKLFEGVFKATHVNENIYLKHLFSYIHLNPIKIFDPKWKEDGIIDYNKAKKYLKDYKYSSYLDYLGNSRIENIIINKKAFPEYFKNFKDFDCFISEWIK